MANIGTKSTDTRILKEKYPEYFQQLEKNYWWNFFSILIDVSLYSFSIAMLSQDTIIPYFVSQLTDKKWIVGLVPALFYFGYFAPQLFGAYIVDAKPTRKKTIVKIAIYERFGIFLIALVAQYLGYFTNQVALILLFIAYAIFSISNGMISPAYSDFIGKNIIKNRGKFYGILGGLGGIIGFSSSYLATFLLNKYAFPINLKTLFWIGLGVSVISPVVISFFKEVPYPVEKKIRPLKEFLQSIPNIVKGNQKFKRFMLIRSFLGFGIMANAFYALYAIEKFNQGPGLIGLFTMIILLAQSASGFFWGWLGDRYGFHLNYILVSVLISVIGLLAVVSVELISFFVIAFCIGSIYSGISTSDPNMIFEIAPPEDTSLFIGIAATFMAPTMTIAPLLGGLLIDLFSNTFLFYTVMLIGTVCTFLTTAYLPKSSENY